MALRDQPYLPLYIQDYLTDEKLNVCSLATQGVYIKIMCVFHKTRDYGGIVLTQKFKQHENIVSNFALYLTKLLPISQEALESAIIELLEEEVLHLDGNFLYQKRMVRDNEVSIKRAKSGSEGGKATHKKIKEVKVVPLQPAKPELDIAPKQLTDPTADEKEQFIGTPRWYLFYYYSGYEVYKKKFNGQSTTENIFIEWKTFIDFIYEKQFTSLFNTKFITPQDYATVITKYKFTPDCWEQVCFRILQSGVRPEHELKYRIPQFIEINDQKNEYKTKRGGGNHKTAGVNYAISKVIQSANARRNSGV